MHELHAQATAVALFAPASRNATANGTGIDAKDYIGIGKVVLHSAAGTGTDPTLDVKLQESADDSTYADISGAVFTQVTDAAASLQSIAVNLDKTKRYIRAVATIDGTTPVFICNCVLLAKKQVN